MTHKKKLLVGSLFSGIGGIDLGLELTGGFRTSFQVEADDYARRVLEKHWPNVRRHDDVHTFPPTPADEWRVDLLAGGFPCPPVSLANRNRRGAADDRWLWPEMRRVCDVLKPEWILVENVVGLLSAADEMGRAGGLFGGILADLARLGFRDIEWHSLSAGDIGAPMERRRIWIVAHTGSTRVEGLVESTHSRGPGPWRWRGEEDLRALAESPTERGDRWPRPILRRVDDGIPRRVDRRDRLRCLGNACVPQCVRVIGERILAKIEDSHGV